MLPVQLVGEQVSLGSLHPSTHLEIVRSEKISEIPERIGKRASGNDFTSSRKSAKPIPTSALSSFEISANFLTPRTYPNREEDSRILCMHLDSRSTCHQMCMDMVEFHSNKLPLSLTIQLPTVIIALSKIVSTCSIRTQYSTALGGRNIDREIVEGGKGYITGIKKHIHLILSVSLRKSTSEMGEPLTHWSVSM